MSLAIQATNTIDSTHEFEIRVNAGTTVSVPFSDNQNVPATLINLEAGNTVEAYVRWPSVDYTFYAWSLDMIGAKVTAPDGTDIYIKGYPDGENFSSAIHGATTVAGGISEHRIKFTMPNSDLQLFPILYSSTSVGISPETRVDLSNIQEIEFDGEIITDLYIDGVKYWDVSNKFLDPSAGVTFLVED